MELSALPAISCVVVGLNFTNVGGNSKAFRMEAQGYLKKVLIRKRKK